MAQTFIHHFHLFIMELFIEIFDEFWNLRPVLGVNHEFDLFFSWHNWIFHDRLLHLANCWFLAVCCLFWLWSWIPITVLIGRLLCFVNNFGFKIGLYFAEGGNIFNNSLFFHQFVIVSNFSWRRYHILAHYRLIIYRGGLWRLGRTPHAHFISVTHSFHFL